MTPHEPALPDDIVVRFTPDSHCLDARESNHSGRPGRRAPSARDVSLPV